MMIADLLPLAAVVRLNFHLYVSIRWGLINLQMLYQYSHVSSPSEAELCR